MSWYGRVVMFIDVGEVIRLIYFSLPIYDAHMRKNPQKFNSFLSRVNDAVYFLDSID